MRLKHLAFVLIFVFALFACTQTTPSSTQIASFTVSPTSETLPAQTAQPVERLPRTTTPGAVAEPGPVEGASSGQSLPQNTTQPVSGAATPLSTPVTSPMAKATLAPDAWQQLPVIPQQISDASRQIYLRGLEMGNNPHAFSKVGDCGSTPSWFLGDFDRGPKYYRLGDYQELTQVIQFFQGSFGRTSLAAKSGFNASSVLTALWADRSQCESKETPLACEYRLNRPSFSLITLGTNDVWHQDVFEDRMRQIIEFSMEKGIVPILATKADNREGDGKINATIARLAVEYDLPLWNYWRAVQDLPDQGLQPDQAHLTWGPNRFDDPQAMQTGWTQRNLTALQVLDVVWRGVTTEKQVSTKKP
jgi:hypothetical protein